MPQNRLTRQIFHFEADCGGAWYTNLSEICASIDMPENLENCQPINIKNAAVKLIDMYKLVWQAELLNSPKLQLYSIIRGDFSAATYMKSNIKKNMRSLISQLICGCLSIEVETGRYSKTPRELRVCKLCNNEVEDEKHFLFDCVKLNGPCIKLYHKNPELLNHDYVNRIKMLLETPYSFGYFIDNMWKLRAEQLKQLVNN